MKRICKLLAATLCFALLLGALPLATTAVGEEKAEIEPETADAEAGALKPVEPVEPGYAGEYYDYPITREKTPEAWTEAGEVENGGHGGWIEVCQIPEDILKVLTTEQLLKSCIHYPLAHELIYFNSPVDGLEFEEFFFNGLQELLRREDLSKVLAQYYASLNPEEIMCGADSTTSMVQIMYTEALTCVAAERDLISSADCKAIAEKKSTLQAAYESYGCPKMIDGTANRATAALEKPGIAFSEEAVNEELRPQGVESTETHM